MGKNSDLTPNEKCQVVQLLADGCSTLNISKQLSRDHRTIKKFTNNSNHSRKRSDSGKFKSIIQRQLVLVKRSLAKNPLSTSKKVFQEAGMEMISRTTRCRVLKTVAACKSSVKIPPLSTENKKKRLDWAKHYMKTDFSNVIFSDECRATLDGPDGFSRGWILDKTSTPSRLVRQQGGGGVMFWAGLHGKNLVGPFRVPDGLKMDSQGYTDFLSRHLLPYYNAMSARDKARTIFMHDNAPSHASAFTKKFLTDNGFIGSRIMAWPAQSPYLNPIENYWSVLKSKIYEGGKQFSSKDELWSGILDAFGRMENGLIEKLVKSVDGRLVEVFKKKGGYINH